MLSVAVTVATAGYWLPLAPAPVVPATSALAKVVAGELAAPAYTPNYSIPWVQELEAGIRYRRQGQGATRSFERGS